MNFYHVEECKEVMRTYLQGNSVLFEGGTYQGKTLNNIIKLAEEINRPFSEVYSCDSFEGLPDEDPNVPANSAEWHKGSFNLAEDFNLKGVDECMQFVRNKVERKDIKLIPGWFEQTLTPELGKKIENQVGYFHLDCDVYSSSKTLFDFAFQNNIMMQGCIVRMDDWHRNFEYFMGQPLAWNIATQKYGVVWIQIGCNLYIYQGHA